ncbi:MAG: hypothetical protein KVP17_003617 [Porospora cf. gigantea B]|uniref:uncharacterized protein n=2 Tax=Porospora cf. gigantea B TaxID=2853592 RepID=UPI003571E5B3|nr:MAG: hypothetical protein KVP17_003617 [Porospora cf. gigantea B]
MTASSEFVKARDEASVARANVMAYILQNELQRDELDLNEDCAEASVFKVLGRLTFAQPETTNVFGTLTTLSGGGLKWAETAWGVCHSDGIEEDIRLRKDWRVLCHSHPLPELRDRVSAISVVILDTASLIFECPSVFESAPDTSPLAPQSAAILGDWLKSGVRTEFLHRVLDRLSPATLLALVEECARLVYYALPLHYFGEARTPLVRVLQHLCSHKETAYLLTMTNSLFSPENDFVADVVSKGRGNGFLYEFHTILGRLMAPTPLDFQILPSNIQSRGVLQRYFVGHTIPPQAIRQQLLAVDMSLAASREASIGIVKALCKSPGRGEVITWFAQALQANSSKATLQGAHVAQMMSEITVPGMALLSARTQGVSTAGFGIEVTAVLLGLCAPINHSMFPSLEPLMPCRSGDAMIGDRLLGKLTDSNAILGIEAYREACAKVTDKEAWNGKFAAEVFWLTCMAIHCVLAPAVKEYEQLIENFVQPMNDQEKARKAVAQLCCWNSALFERNFLVNFRSFCHLLSAYLAHCVYCYDEQGKLRNDRWSLFVENDFDVHRLFDLGLDQHDSPPQLAAFPADVLESLMGVVSTFTLLSLDAPLFPPDIFVDVRPLATLATFFLNSPLSPHLTFSLGASPLLHFTIAHGGATSPAGRAVRQAVLTDPICMRHLLPGIVRGFVEAQKSGYYARIEHRLLYIQLFNELISLKPYQDSLHSIAEDAAFGDLFPRFIHHFVSNLAWVTEEGLSHLTEIKNRLQRGEAIDSTEVPAGHEDDDTNVEAMPMVKLVGICKSLNKAGQLSMKVYTSLASVSSRHIIPNEILLNECILNLNVVLDNLLGPKCLQLKIQNMQRFEFDPRALLASTVTTYLIYEQCARDMGMVDRFLSEIVDEERYFSIQTFMKAVNIVQREGLMSDAEVTRMADFVTTLETALREKESEAHRMQALAGSIPDHFMDPIMGDLMVDPVKLPTSGHVVDRKHIERHLMSESFDPYNRMALTKEDLIPVPELKTEIEQWKRDHLA